MSMVQPDPPTGATAKLRTFGTCRHRHPTQISTPTTATATSEAPPQISHARVAKCRHRSHRTCTSATATAPTGFGYDARDSAGRRTFASARRHTKRDGHHQKRHHQQTNHESYARPEQHRPFHSIRARHGYRALICRPR